MKQRFCVMALVAMLSGSVFYACSDSKTYAEKLADQNESIASFMKRHGYMVTHEVPTVVPWPDGVFYQTESGLYVHVLDTGTRVIDTIPDNTLITIRYEETYMNDTSLYCNMYSSDSPCEILYNNVNSSASYQDCKAWHEALDYVGDKGHVYLIVPASIGWSAYSDDVTAAFYDLRYAFWKQ